MGCGIGALPRHEEEKKGDKGPDARGKMLGGRGTTVSQPAATVAPVVSSPPPPPPQQEGWWIMTSAVYNYNGAETDMNLKELDVGPSGRLEGKGTDEVGEYTMKGRFNVDGIVALEKQYIGKHKVDYSGRLTKNIVNGKWTVGGSSDSFKIEFRTKHYHCQNSYIGLAQQNENAGLFYDDMTHLWGTFWLSSYEGDGASGTLYLADGRSQKIEMSICNGDQIVLKNPVRTFKRE